MPDPVTAFIMDEGQARDLMEDLKNSLELGARTIFVVCDPNYKGNPEREMHVGGDATMDKVPRPDIITGGTVFTAGLTNSIGEVMAEMNLGGHFN